MKKLILAALLSTQAYAGAIVQCDGQEPIELGNDMSAGYDFCVTDPSEAQKFLRSYEPEMDINTATFQTLCITIRSNSGESYDTVALYNDPTDGYVASTGRIVDYNFDNIIDSTAGDIAQADEALTSCQLAK